VTVTLSVRQVAKRAQIAKAARKLFLDLGYAGTSMDAVSAQAKVSKQTLYTYFPTKVDLLHEILTESGALKGKQSHRVVFHEITKNAIREAVAHPRELALRYEPPNPWYRNWWVWAIGGSALAVATGITVYELTIAPPDTIGGSAMIK